MGDDYVTGLPIGDTTAVDDDFDPNAVESDAFLDDEEGDLALDPGIVASAPADDDDDEIMDE